MIDALIERLSPNQVSTAPSVLEQHSRGESYDQAVLPEVVVYPESTADVAAVMALAYRAQIAVTPVAANSSLEGHTVPVKGGISLDLTRLDKILEVRPEDLLIRVQPGVLYPRINERIKRHGLLFPIDPGAHASIGGMVSTNASGTTAVRYGVTADYVLALEVVTPSGEVIRSGSQARKSVSGYNLTRLYCGAEGTLGVITEVTLRLTGLPEAVSAARVPFGRIDEATRFVTSLIQTGIPVARCELLDPLSIAAVNAHQGAHYPEQLTVFLEFHGNPAGLEADARLSEALAQESGALAFDAGFDPDARAQLWEARHSVYYALLAANPGKRNLTTDLAVPISRLPEAIARALTLCRQGGFTPYVLGHVGDGNFHMLLFYDADDAAAYAQASHVNRQLVDMALSLGGTATGEHGVGLRKLSYMQAEHGAALGVMRALKQALDPAGIMNPGKKVPAA